MKLHLNSQRFQREAGLLYDFCQLQPALWESTKPYNNPALELRSEDESNTFGHSPPPSSVYGCSNGLEGTAGTVHTGAAP